MPKRARLEFDANDFRADEMRDTTRCDGEPCAYCGELACDGSYALCQVALLAAHTGVAVDAAKWQPLATGLLKELLPPRHARNTGGGHPSRCPLRPPGGARTYAQTPKSAQVGT